MGSHKVIDLTGLRFGRLQVIAFDRIDKGAWWECACDCGNCVVVRSTCLRRGGTQSCGCGHKGRIITHGLCSKNMRLYSIWHGMLRRCLEKHDKRYENYGGRGIRVCEEWKDYSNFYSWALQSGYRDDLTIDRINVHMRYCPENCRWIEMRQQARNKTNNRKLTVGNMTMLLCDWVVLLGVGISTIQQRLKSGWSVEKALLSPVRRKKYANVKSRQGC
jgi:hypothetical protein